LPQCHYQGLKYRLNFQNLLRLVPAAVAVPAVAVLVLVVPGRPVVPAAAVAVLVVLERPVVPVVVVPVVLERPVVSVVVRLIELFPVVPVRPAVL